MRLPAALAALLAMGVSGAPAQPFFAPVTPARPVVETLHGVTITDRYRWLENGKDPEVVAWSRTQHAATRDWLDRAAPPVPGLKEEIAAWVDRDLTRAPFFRKGREFFMRTRRGEQQAKFYTRLPDGERLLFDPVALDPTGNTAIGDIDLNRDASRAAVATYAKGSEISDYRIIDTRTGAQVGPVLTGIKYFSWARDERYAFISPRTAESDARQEPSRCYRHLLGGPRSEDELLIQMTDAKDECSVYEPDDTDITVFETGSFYQNTVRIRPTASKEAPKLIWTSETSRADITFRRDRFYARSNDKAPNWKLMVGEYAQPESVHWSVLRPEQETVLEDFDVTSRWVVVSDKKDVLTRLMVYERDGRFVRELALPVLGNVSALSYDIDADRLYVALTSFTEPARVYAIDGRSLEWTLLWEDKVPIDTSAIVAERVFVPARDGARIPAFVVRRKDAKLDGNNPVWLDGYGGFNIGIQPYYLGSLASFVNRGGIFVAAGIRGGDEYGERWHEQGMLAAKQTTFDDFIAVAQWLVAEKYTTPRRLAISGGSNGGLTVGAVATQRPDLFAVAVCSVPLLDMLRYHRFLIARYWIPEYGDPDQAADFATLLRYSPYHAIRQGVDIPPMLVVAGEYDSRVDPLHAKKFVAALQNNPGQVSPTLLYMDFDSGHGYGKARAKVIEDRDYEMRFVMNLLGMNGAKR